MPSGEPEPTHVRLVEGGPIMVPGPVSMELPDGTTVRSDRPVVAICACRRSKRYPICDTSHRRRERPSRSAADPDTAPDTAPAGPPDGP